MATNNPKTRYNSYEGDRMSERKTAHLDICLHEPLEALESGNAGFDHVHLVHHSLPELNEADLDITSEFLGYSLKLPLFISSMTGGSKDSYKTNQDLAKAAQSLGIGVGMGSIRILFRKPEVLEHFQLKSFAPDVPVWANLGGIQIRDMVHTQIIEMLKKLEVDALAIHLNPAQELFQAEGDRDYTGVLQGIKRFCEVSPVPVIVKETGCGIHPAEIVKLLKAGARYVNVAGSGGTSWIKIEDLRNTDFSLKEQAKEFDSWGNPTALILASLKYLENSGRLPSGGVPPPLFSLMEAAEQKIQQSKKPPIRKSSDHPVSEGLLGGKILASGGLRNGMDLVKSLVLGARLAGMALPFLRLLDTKGLDGILEFAQTVEGVLKKALLLTNCQNLDQLRASACYYDQDFRKEVEEYSNLFR